PGITMEKMSASLQGRAGAVLTLKAEATSDDGTLHLDGTINTEGGANAVELNLYGARFQAVRIPEASVWISPNLKISFADSALRVDGSLEVPRADITPKSIDQGVGVSADQVVVRREAEPDKPGPAIYADIRVLLIGDPGMRIDGLGLKSKLSGELRIFEEPGIVTRARGELQLKEGRYKAYGQDLTITTGKLLFTGGPVTQPAVELRATRQPREDITVGVLVRGKLDKPEFSLFSTPAMPQERQLSWLVLGRQLDQTSGSAERGRVADAAVSLGLAGGEWLAQRYGGKLGFDEIGIGARPGESTDLAQLTIGKYLSPKLFISYGLGLFQPGHSFRMQYDLGGGFKLASEAGVESGGDLLYTIEK
ncbi:MAG: translocation/assembly module TamB domain-containing protein, partial [Pseudomonadota bacterium]|nr:translocation/assembly module TamB domain-containing protein [Pseudomonadota bacterium]